MPTARQTSILANEFERGYSAEFVENGTGGPETFEIKDAPGKVARVVVVSAIDVTLMDGTTAIWPTLSGPTDFNLAGTPMQFDESISLALSGDGDVYILYK